eukprot:6248996-Alexandrium_andersonii.AAC.1
MELHAVLANLFSGQHGLAFTAGAGLMHESVVMLLQRFHDFALVAADAEDRSCKRCFESALRCCHESA